MGGLCALCRSCTQNASYCVYVTVAYTQFRVKWIVHFIMAPHQRTGAVHHTDQELNQTYSGLYLISYQYKPYVYTWRRVARYSMARSIGTVVAYVLGGKESDVL
jgi:hypothetical protein